VAAALSRVRGAGLHDFGRLYERVQLGDRSTDLAGGSRFGYTLLVVVLLSNLMAILLRALAVRLGIATGAQPR
jgi:hypothetical protein